MINEVIISRLDELIGDYNTPFFNYLLYSYDLTLNDCEDIIDDLKRDINDNRVLGDNLVSVLDDYFKSKVIQQEKESKIEYLSDLISTNSDFYIRYLEGYGLDDDEISLIFDKVRDRILADNISDFEIKRYLEYYFSNSVKQISYVNDLNRIVGKNYDTLIIRNVKRKYPILRDSDIVQIIFDIHGEIIDAKEFKNGIQHEFKSQCMLRSEDKKAKCRRNLDRFVEGSGDSFSKLVEFKGLSKKDGMIIVSQIRDDISQGRIQPEEITNTFITKRFNEYNERQ
jgi:hypothetical protein